MSNNYLLVFFLFIVIPISLITASNDPQQQQSNQLQCSAGVRFLNPKSLNLTPSKNSTYVIHVSYPCDSSPQHSIQKLRDRVRDPFVSFYLKKQHTKGQHSVVRAKRLSEYQGSGDYDDDDDDDDDEDDEDDEETPEEEHDAQNEIDFEKSLYPSNHVVVLLPTPTVEQTSYSSSEIMPASFAAPEVTASEIVPTKSYYPTHSYVTTEQNNHEDLVFPNVGSGDGPLVLTTPVYNPTDDSVVSSSSTPYYPSSSHLPTPTLSTYLLHPIPKQLIYSGVQNKLVVPFDTFQPPCYEYKLLEHESWIDVKKNVVRFFPVTVHISDYNLKLECEHHTGVADLFVSVRQRQKSRLHNHAFILEFGMLRGNHSRVEVLGKLVDEVSAALGGNSSNGSELVVLSTELDTYPFRVSYVNETIISNVCPVDEMKRIYEKLTGINGFVKMESVKVSIPPDNNQCDPGVVSSITGEKSVVGYGENYPPSIKNQIDRLNGSVGEYLIFSVREDFCYDPEDGGTRNLKVELRSNELSPVDEGYWLQFDGKNQEFYGLPMEIEEREFVLVCSDRAGKSANDVLELQITASRVPPSAYNTEFSVHFQSIPFTPKAIRKFIEKLSSVLSSQIHVHSYSESNNHVLFKWFNTSNPSSEHEVTEIRKVLLSDDGPVNKRLFEHFSPEFNITVASVVPLRSLLSENNPVDDKVGGGKHEDQGGRYFDFEPSAGIGGGGGGDFKERDGGGGGSSGGDHGVVNVDNYSGYLTTYIIPSVLIAVMILLALIIACLLSRKNKYTQASTEDDSPNARVYLKNAKKGVPVIFQDELDEKLFGPPGQGGPHRGNIYEPPRSGTGTPHTHHAPPQRNDSSSTGMQSPRVISPQPTHPSRGYPQPPDYQNSISRRNRGPMGGLSSPPPGGVPLFSNQHAYDRTPQHHHPQHHHQHIDAYAPPPGINYYGIHNSNSGGSGFSGVSDRTGGYGGNVAGQHHHVGNKMAPPPYVPP